MYFVGASRAIVIFATIANVALVGACSRSISASGGTYTHSPARDYFVDVTARRLPADSVSCALTLCYYRRELVLLNVDSLRVWGEGSSALPEVFADTVKGVYAGGLRNASVMPIMPIETMACRRVALMRGTEKSMRDNLKWSFIMTVYNIRGDSVIEVVPVSGEVRLD